VKISKPDIALFDKTGKVFAVIEIVVTHKPEDTVIKYYKENNIVLIQIELDSENDLENIDNKLESAARVNCISLYRRVKPTAQVSCGLLYRRVKMQCLTLWA
jgi:hypothetical protein